MQYNKMGLFPLIALAMLLSGCLMGKNYKRPEMAPPTSYRLLSPESADGVTTGTLMADAPWWEMFKDEQLQELIRTALAENLDVKIALAKVNEARAMVGVDSADLYPKLTANGTGTRTRTANSKLQQNQVSTSNNFTGLLDLSYEADLWGRYRRTRESAIASMLSSEQDRRTAISTLISDVAQNYFTLLELEREQQITSDMLVLYEQTLGLAEAKFREGFSSQLDVTSYQAEVEATKASLDSLKDKIFQSENALSILLGEPPTQISRKFNFESQSPIPSIPVGLPSDLLERRPDILSAEQLLGRSQCQYRRSKSRFFSHAYPDGGRGI